VLALFIVAPYVQEIIRELSAGVELSCRLAPLQAEVDVSLCTLHDGLWNRPMITLALPEAIQKRVQLSSWLHISLAHRCRFEHSVQISPAEL
jgi:hypothetical protein